MVVGFGTYDARVHPRVAIVLDGLAERGAHVVECNVPLGFSTAQRVAMLRQPWRLPLLAGRLAACWARLAARSRSAPRADVVVVGYLGHFDVQLARRLYPRTPIVLDHLIGAGDTAADRGVGGRARGRLLRGLDRAALRAADVVAVDTEEHLALLPADLRGGAVVVPVGASRAWFAAGEARSREPDPAGAGRALRVVFFGLYTPLQGAGVIGGALALLAGAPVEVTMVGTGQDYRAARAAAAGNTRVTWLDWVDPAELPGVVAGFDVCLGIFGTTPKALRVVPNKVYQGAAAGCAVVTSDTAAQRRALGDGALFVPPGDARALAEVLRSLAARPDLAARSRLAARERAEDRFTAGAVVARLATRLCTLPGLETLSR